MVNVKLLETELRSMGEVAAPPATRGLTYGAQPGTDEADEETEAAGAGGRQCTDILCLMIFLAFLGGMCFINLHAHRHGGDIRKLTHGFDWKGHVCGVADDTANAEKLFWCAKDSSALALTDGICVHDCPSDDKLDSLCPDEAHGFSTKGKGTGGAAEKWTIGFTRTLTKRKNYATVDVLNYCFPTENDALMKAIMDQTPLGSYAQRLWSGASAIHQSTHYLILVALAAIVFGYLFLFLLKEVIEPFVYTLLALSTLLLLGGLFYFVAAAIVPSWNVYVAVTETHATALALGTAGFFLVMCILFAVLVWHSSQAVEVTVKAIEEACDVLVAMPTLLLQPLLQCILKLVTFACCMHGLMWVISLGDMHVEMGFDPFDPTQYSSHASGVARKFTFTNSQKYMIAYWIFGSVWLLEIVNALGNFAISHAVVVYTIWDIRTLTPLARGYYTGFVFHLGSIAFGAFIIGVLKAVTVVLAWFAKQAHTVNEDDPVNMAVQVLLKCCVCCMGCLTRVMEFVNEMVYADIAASGSNYTRAAARVLRCMAGNPISFATMKGVTNVVRALGMMVIGGGGTFISYKVIGDAQWQAAGSFALGGASSMLVSSNVLATTIVAGFICFGVAECFMSVFDHTAETLTYAILQKKHLFPGSEPPESWKLAGASDEYQAFD